MWVKVSHSGRGWMELTADGCCVIVPPPPSPPLRTPLTSPTSPPPLHHHPSGSAVTLRSTTRTTPSCLSRSSRPTTSSTRRTGTTSQTQVSRGGGRPMSACVRRRVQPSEVELGKISLGTRSNIRRVCLSAFCFLIGFASSGVG